MIFKFMYDKIGILNHIFEKVNILNKVRKVILMMNESYTNEDKLRQGIMHYIRHVWYTFWNINEFVTV